MAAKKKSEDVPPIPVAPDASPAAVAPEVPETPAAPVVPEAPEAPQVAAGPPPAPAAVTPEFEPRPNPYAAPAAPYGAPAAPPYGAPAQPNPYAVTQNYDYTTGTYVTTPVQPQGLSIASMVTGIVAVLLTFASFGFIPGVVAVVLGHLAQKRQPQARAMWITGLITGYIAAGLGILTGLFWLAIILIIPGAAMWGDFS
ncbi:DUF4190 domain-containing protein [Glaciihabitans arcticus]|uniref:DUF4190 domain-containing protein n=1 Tax=Glaciihabitans arcticus TaxID=2668039 RepID=A0A4Q9GT18_9MICO|nr:DUF4190 domain-containing protein [Glaciihabitans arcticus]TBN57785.1 DUF4190 domain-containing protein [Glaciihabitans arcticus]